MINNAIYAPYMPAEQKAPKPILDDKKTLGMSLILSATFQDLGELENAIKILQENNKK